MQALEIAHLTKIYGNGQHALHGIDLTVREGDFLALLGPNGAGKSTTIGIVTSLVRKTGGTVTVFGHDLDRAPVQVKSCIGLVPQEINFSQFESVLEIVLNQAGFYGIPRTQAMARAEICLGRLGLWDRRHDAARTLSGGMKRKLLTARALLHEPRLLILDEPTAGVDIETRRAMWAFMQEINRTGTTIILTTHYLEEAETLCRNIAIIDRGRIVENTSMRALLAKLHVETFVLDLAAEIEAPPPLAGYLARRIDAHTIEVEVDAGRDVNGLFAQLSSAGIAVRSMRNKANRLEELFVRLVGEGAGEVATREVAS
ncbi:MAG: ABC transporter ATP-binding protein [Gammaproteobacteria bacterium]